jgi:RNA polymerase sigma-70 factor (ECF subfamily)
VDQDPEALDLAAGTATPEQSAQNAASETALENCLDTLSDEQRNAVVLAYLEGHSHAELAERLSSPLGTVKSWVRRGLDRLKTCLQGLGGAS